ncbi:MAG: response regulator transcription factor [Anaerolineales bacterium]|nr:response regulator transcription factor [Anaerolineales bacterium]
MHEKITVLVVDDHEVVRQGICAFLKAQPDIDVVAEAAGGEQAVTLVREMVPDVVIMDLVLRGMDGVEATRQVKTISPRTQIVVLTSYHQDEYIFPALQAGAISYIIKDTKMEEIAMAILSAARGEPVLHPRIASRVIKELSHSVRDEANPFTDLSDREIQVIKLLARGMKNTVIAGELSISEYTVRGHVSNILSKLQLADRTQAAVYAWQKGLVHRE